MWVEDSGAWASAADAFRDDFAAGQRVQAASWGGFAILGYHELQALARNPLADGMPPDEKALAATPEIYRLLNRALFTQSGLAHRAERAASIEAFNEVDLVNTIDRAINRVANEGPADLDLRSGYILPVMLSVWAEIVGYDVAAAARLSNALRDLGYVLSANPDVTKAHLADKAAEELRLLSLAALETGTPFAKALRTHVGDDRASELVAGMTFDAIDTASVGIDAALRVAIAYVDQLRPDAQSANECLRLASSTPMSMRLTTGEIELGDLKIPQGTPLSMIWSAGNHDPLAFDQPERFNPDRGRARPLMFGMGQHSCLGHAIVRTSLIQMLEFIARRRPRFEGSIGGWNPLGADYLPPIRLVLPA